MKKQDLQNGDIIVTKNGYLGIVIKNEGDEYIVYQEVGMDFMDDLNDDLTYVDEGFEDDDVMEVYRDSFFLEIDDCGAFPIWQRDENWLRPSAETRRKREEEKEKARRERIEAMRIREAQEAKRKKNDYINVIVQQFYGNRTGTEVERENVVHLLHGFVDMRLAEEDDVVRDEDIRMIPVPGAEHIVIIYDQAKEEQYVNEDLPELYEEFAEEYKQRTGKEMVVPPSCEIPALGFKIYTRCLACRIDEDGVLQSLEGDDYKYFIDYLAE